MGIQFGVMTAIFGHKMLNCCESVNINIHTESGTHIECNQWGLLHFVAGSAGSASDGYSVSTSHLSVLWFHGQSERAAPSVVRARVPAHRMLHRHRVRGRQYARHQEVDSQHSEKDSVQSQVLFQLPVTYILKSGL